MSASARRTTTALGTVALVCLRLAVAGGLAGSSSVVAAPPHNAVGRGQSLYAAHCAACHQASGDGIAGAFPPLKGSAVLNRSDATKHIDIVLGGLQGARVSGITYRNPMPAFAAALSDADIAAIIDYERGAWGNRGSFVGAAQVTSERARLK
jgi:mono/diheme cytochrome c family protein